MLRAAMVLAVATGDLMQTAQETERTTSDLGLSLKRRGATDTYSAYIRTQQSKLDKVRTKIDAIDVGRQHQVKREFAKALAEGTAGLASLRGKTVLCLGARLGGEVRAFKALGAVALGIDLNPGRSNMDVVAGDFHAIPFPDASFDYAYSNVLDHVFDATGSRPRRAASSRPAASSSRASTRARARAATTPGRAASPTPSTTRTSSSSPCASTASTRSRPRRSARTWT